MPNTDIGIGLPYDQFFFLALPGDIPSESPVQRTRVDHWYLELGCRSPGGATVTSLALRCLDLGPWFQFLILLVGFKTKPLLEPRLENLDVLTSPHCSKNQQWLLQSFDYLNPKIGSIHNNRSFRQDRQSTSKTKRMWQGRRALSVVWDQMSVYSVDKQADHTDSCTQFHRHAHLSFPMHSSRFVGPKYRCCWKRSSETQRNLAPSGIDSLGILYYSSSGHGSQTWGTKQTMPLIVVWYWTWLNRLNIIKLIKPLICTEMFKVELLRIHLGVHPKRS